MTFLLLLDKEAEVSPWPGRESVPELQDSLFLSSSLFPKKILLASKAVQNCLLPNSLTHRKQKFFGT